MLDFKILYNMSRIEKKNGGMVWKGVGTPGLANISTLNAGGLPGHMITVIMWPCHSITVHGIRGTHKSDLFNLKHMHLFLPD